jgi:ankyrin repeat protein
MKFMFNAAIGGLMALLDELTSSWRYSIPTLALTVLFGVLAFLILRRFVRNRYCVWALTGAWIAFLVATIRIGLVFGIQVLGGSNLVTICMIFIPSGAIAGLAVTRFQREGFAMFGAVIGIAIGVLYHLQLAQGWMSAQPIEGTILFLMEFLGPTLFGVLTTIWLRWCGRSFYRGAGLEGAAGVHAAVKKADIGRLKNLLQDQPELIEARDDDGKTPLHRVVDYLSVTSSPAHQHILTFLLTNGARVNTKSLNLLTPLHQLSYFGVADVVALFLDHGAEVDAREKRDQTPLEYAALQGHTAVIELLVQRGADPNASDQMGRMPLHCAAENGHISAARALLARGATLNIADLEGFSPFYLAVEHGHKDLVDFLIQSGADLNRHNKAGWTPYRIAVAKGYADLAQLLVKAGATTS